MKSEIHPLSTVQQRKNNQLKKKKQGMTLQRNANLNSGDVQKDHKNDSVKGTH